MLSREILPGRGAWSDLKKDLPFERSFHKIYSNGVRPLASDNEPVSPVA